MNTGDFGNPDWLLFVFLAYGAVAVGLGGYAFFCFRNRRQSLKSLKDEGFFAD